MKAQGQVNTSQRKAAAVGGNRAPALGLLYFCQLGQNLQGLFLEVFLSDS